MTTQQHTSDTSAGEYIGRHRNPKRRPAPLPMANLDGLLDAAVTVSLSPTDPYVMLSSDHDQAVISLTDKQVQRILAGVLRGMETPDHCVCETGVGVAACPVHADYDPTDDELRVDWNAPTARERTAHTARLVADIESGAVA